MDLTLISPFKIMTSNLNYDKFYQLRLKYSMLAPPYCPIQLCHLKYHHLYLTLFNFTPVDSQKTADFDTAVDILSKNKFKK